MNLTLDIGNTCTKIIVFDDTIPVYRKETTRLTADMIRKIIRNYPIESGICSAVTKVKGEVLSTLKSVDNFFTLSSPIPIRNLYKTPATLGNDRLANAVAAAFLFPKRYVLVVDAGTCIKYDFVNAKNEYLGGSISPGLDMRFRALNHFTGKLPLIKYREIKELTGNTTETAILTGVINGMKEEIRGMILQYQKKYKKLEIILTGGHASRFVNDLNLSIFAAADLVNLGLNEIIRFNVRSK